MNSERPPGYRAGVFAAVLGVALLLGGAPAAAEPVLKPKWEKTVDLYPGAGLVGHAGNFFDEPGLNAGFSGAVFSRPEYMDPRSGITSSRQLSMATLTAAKLNALASPPDSPFTFTVTLSMDNEQGGSATATLTFRTTYEKEEASLVPAPPPPAGPPVSAGLLKDAPPGEEVTVGADEAFDNAGTNPVFTQALFGATENYDESGIEDGVLKVKAKPGSELSAMTRPPPNPFTVTATVTMENDEGETATGPVTFKTEYETEDPPAAPADPPPAQTTEPPPAAPVPVQPGPPADLPPTQTGLSKTALPGVPVAVDVDEAFDNAGPNARFTAAVFSETKWYEPGSGLDDGRLLVLARSDAALLAMTPRPPNPFTVTATVTMENDDGETAEGTVTFVTAYGG